MKTNTIRLVALAVMLAIGLAASTDVNAQSSKKKPAKSKSKSKSRASVVVAEEKPTEKAMPPAKEAQEDTKINEDEITIEQTGDNIVTIGGTPIKFQDVVEEMPTGQVNWTNQVVVAKGMSVLDYERFKNKAQARAMAIQGARADAQRKLLETIKGVHVIGETTVNDMITSSDVVKTRVEGVLKGAMMVGEPVEKDGAIEVSMQVGMYGNGSLANAVVDRTDETEVKTSLRAREDEPVSMQISSSDQKMDEETVDEGKPGPLVFNLNGKKIDPTMFPLVVDEKGKLLLDMSKVYNSANGKFPKVIQTGKEIMSELGMKKGLEVINVLQADGGKITVDTSRSKINWAKIGRTAAKIGKFLLMLI